jgi:hypothetical protein
MMPAYNKAQLEVMGLAMIVVIISVGFIFVTQFSGDKKDTSLIEEYTSRQISTTYLEALLKSNAVGCHKADVETLLRDCAGTKEIVCEDGTKSCNFLNRTLTDLFRTTLVNWTQEFRFSASLTPLSYRNGECNLYEEPNYVLMPTESGVMNVQMVICRSTTYTGTDLNKWITPGAVIDSAQDRNRLYMRDSSGNNMAWFGDSGNVVIKGMLEQNSVHARTANDEWIINNNGQDVLIFDTSNGNLYIDGYLYENQSTITPIVSANDFFMKDNSSNIVIYINESGYMFIQGALKQYSNP